MERNKPKEYQADRIGYYRALPHGEVSRPLEFGQEGWGVYYDTPSRAEFRAANQARVATMPQTLRLYNGPQYGQKDESRSKAPALSKKPRGMTQTFYETTYRKQAKKAGRTGS